MKATISFAAAAAAMAASVSAHGNITAPPARLPGPAFQAACGQQAVASINADGTIPLENITPATTACQLDLCRGATFEDNQNRVQQFAPGQVVNFRADLPIPHEGPANVSIVDTATNQVVGPPLIEFDSYADENLAALPANNTNFNVTIPTNLPAGTCSQAGACVLQWFWFGTNAQQTYESCVDFVLAPAAGAATAGAATAAGANVARPATNAGTAGARVNTGSRVTSGNRQIV